MQPFYECNYCGKKMAKKTTFDKHECEQLKRHKLCRTKTGLTAFEDYRYWLRKKNNKNIRELSTFVNSRAFNAFIEFQNFVKKQGIPDTRLYIDFMVSIGVVPSLWRSPDFYDKFIEYFDSQVPPLTKIKITVLTLDSIASVLDCDVHEVFRYLYPSEVATLVHERRLSPWILLLSGKFLHYMHMVKDPAQHTMLTTVINPRMWKEILSSDQAALEKAKMVVQELNL